MCMLCTKIHNSQASFIECEMSVIFKRCTFVKRLINRTPGNDTEKCICIIYIYLVFYRSRYIMYYILYVLLNLRVCFSMLSPLKKRK